LVRLPTLGILTSTSKVTVTEGSTATFQVKLNTAPVKSTTVTVIRVSGDTNITVQSGASRVFNAATWNTYQAVTLRATHDADRSDGVANIRCSAPGLAIKYVTATEGDDGRVDSPAPASLGGAMTGNSNPAGNASVLKGSASVLKGNASVLKGNVNVLEPIDVRTSNPEPDTNGWKAVDGNPETFWQGQTGARGWWLALTYGKDVKAQDVQVQWAEGSSTGLVLLGSADADQWYELAPLLKQGPVSFGYLWLMFPENEAGVTPKVSEIRVDSDE